MRVEQPDGEIRPADFTIVSKPNYISLMCPHCYSDIKIPWKDVCVPDYWGDDWGEVECPDCHETIKLGDYEYD